MVNCIYEYYYKEAINNADKDWKKINGKLMQINKIKGK